MSPLEEAIFHTASQLDDGQARAAFLDRTCGAEPALRARIEALLAADVRARQFLSQDPLGFGATSRLGATSVSSSPEGGSGTLIGRYKLLQKIGEGGMGVVYMAEQQEPVRRRVALKIIKLGMDTKQVVARFEAERQALALMDHPNIARVLDGGATATGRPYFVMELVQGVPITEFCDKNHLSVQQRLQLFIPVCQAIQSAHQKGVIHRDLKPSNILVTLNPDGTGFPKVIDFGVAKATSQKLTEKTLFTAHGIMVGTPTYMSPEQAEMSHLDVDTRADIYSLGALLYELMTGTPPFPEQRLRSAGYNEMQRIILEEQPERPSTRLSTLQGEQRSIVARNRGASELTLGRGFPGDLDWIVMKCLEKDRARRYETANGLALDLERHLKNEPIVARPPSRLYEFQKTVRRHWVGFCAVAAVLAALSLGVAVSTSEAVRAHRSEANEAKQKATAQQFLYKSLLGEAHATRLARKVGYRDQVLALLSQAKALDVPERNLADLRREAVACLGDFVGLTPATFTNFPTNLIAYACLDPAGKLAAFGWGLESGAIQLRQLPTGELLASFNRTNEYLNDLCFNSAGDELCAKYGVPFGHFSSWARDVDGHWRQKETRALTPFTTKLLRSPMGVFALNLRQTDNKAPLSLSLYRSVIGRAWVVKIDSPRPGDAENHYVRFRLIDPYTGAFVPGYELTNAVPPRGEMSFCMGGDGSVLAVETRDLDDPESAALVNLYGETGKRLAQFRRRITGTLAGTGPLILSDDGKYLLNLTEAGGTIYTVPGLERVARLRTPYYGGLMPHIAGNMVALPEAKTIRLWDLTTGMDIAVLDEPDDAWPVGFSADGTSLLTAGPHHARLYRLKTPEKLDLPPHTAAVPGVAFSPDGLRLASVGKDRVVRVCDAFTGRTLWETNDLPGLGQCVSFSPDGQWLATGVWDKDLVWIRDAQTGRRLHELGTGQPGQAWAAQFSPDGWYLATAGRFTNGVRIYALDHGKSGNANSALEVKLIKSWGSGSSVLFAPDSGSLAFTSPPQDKEPDQWEWKSSDRPLYLWDFERSVEPRALAFRIVGMVAGEGFTPDARHLLALDASGDILTLDATTGKRISSFHADDPQFTPAAVVVQPSPDGSKLAVGVGSPLRSGVSVLDPSTGKLLYSLPAEPGDVYWLAWSPDSRRLAVSRDNGNIAIWNLDTVNQVLAQLGLNP